MSTQPIPHGTRTQCFEQMSSAVQKLEIDRLPVALQQERIWLAESKLSLHEDRSSILGSIALGEIVAVPSGADLPFRQYYQDRTNKAQIETLPEANCSVPYLRPEALSTMMRITHNARQRFFDSEDGEAYMEEFGITNLQYSVTSMLRTRRYQQELVRHNALALDGDSAHLFGVAFDIDHSGYYVKKDGSSEVISVNGLQNPSLYSDAPILALHQELEASASHDELAFVTELPTGRGCWHVTANPLIQDRGETFDSTHELVPAS